MARVEFSDYGYHCGTCDTELAGKYVRWPMPVFLFVHAADHRYRCYGRRWFGASAMSKPQLLPPGLRCHSGTTS